MKLAFQITSGAVVLIDTDAERLWVVYTIEQYADVDAAHGTFQHNQISFVGAVLRPSAPPVQHLVGTAASMVADGLMEAIVNPDPHFLRRLSQGITAVNWRTPRGDNSTVVCGRKGESVFFGVAFDLPQLTAFQQQFFPDEPERVTAFQFVARLPASSATTAFTLTGVEALIAIDGCHRRGYLS